MNATESVSAVFTDSPRNSVSATSSSLVFQHFFNEEIRRFFHIFVFPINFNLQEFGDYLNFLLTLLTLWKKQRIRFHLLRQDRCFHWRSNLLNLQDNLLFSLAKRIWIPMNWICLTWLRNNGKRQWQRGWHRKLGIVLCHVFTVTIFTTLAEAREHISMICTSWKLDP